MKLIKLTDAATRLEVHIDPKCIHGLHHLAPAGAEPEIGQPARTLRTRVDCAIGGRAQAYFVVETPTQILQLVKGDE